MTLKDYVESLKEKSIAVIGIGISNRPLIELLLNSGCNVTACDMRSFEELGEYGVKLREMGAKLKLGEDYLDDLNQD
ncbi:UDP-N-acetylmuramoylalanine--D-glutamate ligase, partial [gut metagenome]